MGATAETNWMKNMDAMEVDAKDDTKFDAKPNTKVDAKIDAIF